jgi:hypothetical protein
MRASGGKVKPLRADLLLPSRNPPRWIAILPARFPALLFTESKTKKAEYRVAAAIQL